MDVVGLAVVVVHDEHRWSLDSHDVLHGPYGAVVAVAALRLAPMQTDMAQDAQVSLAYVAGVSSRGRKIGL